MRSGFCFLIARNALVVYKRGMSTITPEVHQAILSFSRLTFIVTREEDQLLHALQDFLQKQLPRCHVYSPTHGLMKLQAYLQDLKSATLTVDTETMGLHDTLIKIYRDNPGEDLALYIILDAERVMRDEQAVRRVLDILHQGQENISMLKLLILVGTNKFVHPKLAPYCLVFHDKGLTDQDIQHEVETVLGHFDATPHSPEELKRTVKMLRGMMSYDIRYLGIKSMLAKSDNIQYRPEVIDAFKKAKLGSSDLVNYIQTDESFEHDVGGQERFKKWAQETRACWTEQGQAFGLQPPKGVLCVGVYGCGKSLSVKALGKAWGLNVIALEVGRLRSSGVGETENNVYKVTRLIESVAPCIVWMDEAEKSLSGGGSSGQSDAGTASRTLGILSTWLQETKAPICLALTANSLATLPPEFVNRMNTRFFFGLPTADTRAQILRIHLAKFRQDPNCYDLPALAAAAKGLVGREIGQAVEEAMTLSYNQLVARHETLQQAQDQLTLLSGQLTDATKRKDGAAQQRINGELAVLKGQLAALPEAVNGLDGKLLEALLAHKPRILKTMQKEVQEIVDWVGYDPDTKEGIRARLASDPEEAEGLQLV